MDFANYFSWSFIVKTTVVAVLVLVGFLGLAMYSRSGKIEASLSVCRAENASAVLADQCDSLGQGGTCITPFYKDITFSQPYAVAPHVLVTLNQISAGPSCAKEETDKAVCYPINITTTGFRLICSGSPVEDGCGAGTNANYTMGKANWIATDANPACGASSGHQIVPTECNVEEGGLCALGSFSKRINFSTPFSSVPQVITAAENVSDQEDCVEGETDQVLCFASEITASGFTLRCSGSPFASCGTSEGFKTRAAAGWLAMENTSQRKVQSQHALKTDECSASIVEQTCSSGFRKAVIFPEPFSAIPKVTVSPELITDSSGVSQCAQGASDKYHCEAIDVTATGFTSVCFGSPKSDECGQAQEDNTTSATFSYIAVEANSSSVETGGTSGNGGACVTDLDCGTNGFNGSLTCENNDVYQNYTTYHCNASSECANTTVSQVKQTCAAAQECNAGGCSPEVW